LNFHVALAQFMASAPGRIVLHPENRAKVAQCTEIGANSTIHACKFKVGMVYIGLTSGERISLVAIGSNWFGINL
jgi:hypothetical protein